MFSWLLIKMFKKSETSRITHVDCARMVVHIILLYKFIQIPLRSCAEKTKLLHLIQQTQGQFFIF